MNSQTRFDEMLVEIAAIEKDATGVLSRLNSPSQTVQLERAAHALLAAIRKHPTAPVIARRPEQRDVNVTGNRPGTGRVEYRNDHDHLTGMA